VGTYRVKGSSTSESPGTASGSAARRRRYLRFDRSPWPRDEQRRTSLELIGSGIDPGALREALTSCERAEPADPDSMLAVMRYSSPPVDQRCRARVPGDWLAVRDSG